MMDAKRQDGSQRFTAAEYLSAAQIMSYFSREASRRRKLDQADDKPTTSRKKPRLHSPAIEEGSIISLAITHLSINQSINHN